MMRLVWLASAQADLREITRDITRLDASVAEDLSDRIGACAESLADHPYVFPAGRVSGTREALVYPNYALTYRACEDIVEIVSVHHTCRQYPSA